MNYGEENYMIWVVGIAGYWYFFRKICRKITNNKIYNIFNLVCMCANTLILTTDGLVEGETA